MLHSALPRAYLATASMGGYSTTSRFLAEEIRQPFAYVHQHQQQQRLEDTYTRLGWYASPPVLGSLEQQQQQQHHHHHHHHHHHQQQQQQQQQQQHPRRIPSPCPLDLSLKPPPTPSTPSAEACDDCEAIEVDDEEDRRSREEARSVHQPFAERLLDELEELESHRTAAHRRFGGSLMDYSHLQSNNHQDAQRKMVLSSPDQLQSYQQLLTPPPPPPPLAPPATHIHAPMTPPSTPSPPQCPRRRARDEEMTSAVGTIASPRQAATSEKVRVKRKHARKLKFDEDTSSPVSGTVILGPDEAVVTGDIDPAFNIVEVTEEARAELAKIENRLGPYQCKLCRQLHEDAFQLAQHRCSRIAHVEYRCPECDKRFSCPANLASHRRWHKPRPPAQVVAPVAGEELSCARCDARFGRHASLRKHLATQHPEESSETPIPETA